MRPCHISSAKHVPYRCFGFCASHMVIKCLLFVIIHNMSIRVSMREFVHCALFPGFMDLWFIQKESFVFLLQKLLQIPQHVQILSNSFNHDYAFLRYIFPSHSRDSIPHLPVCVEQLQSSSVLFFSCCRV